jgi:hypothetical protein
MIAAGMSADGDDHSPSIVPRHFNWRFILNLPHCLSGRINAQPPSGPIDLGTVELPEEIATLRVEVIGTNEKSGKEIENPNDESNRRGG